MSPLVLWLWIALGAGIVIGLASFVPEYLGLRRRHRDQCDSYDRLHADGTERLTALVADLGQTETQLAETRTELSTWQRTAKTEAAEKDGWRRKFDETSAEVAERTHALSARDTRIGELAEEVAGLEAEIAGLNEAIATLRADLMTGGDRIAAIEAQLDDTTGRLAATAAELADTRSKLHNAESSLAALVVERDAVVERCEHLDRERTALTAEITRLKEHVATHEGNAGMLGVQVEKLIGERDESTAAHASLQTELANREKHIVRLRKRSRGRLKQIRQLEETIATKGPVAEQRLQQRIDVLGRRSRSRLREIRRLEREIAEHAGAGDARLSKKLDSVRKKSNDRRKALRILEAEKLALAEKGNEMARKIEDLEEISRKLSEHVDKGPEARPSPPKSPEPESPRYHESSTES